MAIEKALVLEIKGDRALVQTQRKSSCQSCQLENSCGQGLLTKVGSERAMELWVDNYLDARPGQIISLSVPDEGLLKASALMFLLPLMFMLAGAGIALSVFSGDIPSIIGGAIGLFLGFSVARHKSAGMQDDERFQPVMNAVQLDSAEGGACVPKSSVDRA